MTDPLLLAAASAFLISVYKPLLIFAVFVPWAWLVSSKLEKDARYNRINFRLFNGVYLGCAVAALAVMLFVPIFWVGWPLGIVVLATPVFAYNQVRNRTVAEKDRFKFTAKALTGKMAANRRARTAQASVRFTGPNGTEHSIPRKDDPRHAVHLAVEDLLVPALEARARNVDVAVGPRGNVVTQSVDGIRFKRDAMAPDLAMSVIDYVKEVGGLNIEDRRRRQTAGFKMDGPMGRTELTLITAGSSSGQEMRIIFNRSKQVIRPIDDLGLLPGQLEALRVTEQEPERHGVFLFGAPPGHGLTTTGYSLIGRHDAYTSNVKTLEHEIEGTLDGVDHVQWDSTNPDVDFPTNLQSILRRDPDVVLIGRLTDAHTAKVAADPGMEGPLIYVPQRATSITDQIRQWAKLVGDVKRAIRPLTAVMNQRLLRRVCPNCRQSYQPTAEQLRKMNVPADKVQQLYQASGKIQVKNKIETCPVCAGAGYFGQLGVFQVMLINDDIRRLLTAGDLKGALAEARRNKMLYLQEAALRKVVDGETTIDEVVRVTAPARTAATPPKSEAKPAPAT